MKGNGRHSGAGREKREKENQKKKREDLLAANVCPFCHILAV